MQHTHAFMCLSGSLFRSAHPPSSYSLDAERQQSARFAYSNLLYENISIGLSQGYAVIYVVENSVTNAIRNLSKNGVLEVEDYVERGALRIVPADSFFSPSETNLDYNVLLPQWHKVISSVREERFKRIMVIGMPHKAFFETEASQRKLIEYEEQSAKFHDGSFQAICCYTRELLERLPLSNIIRLLTVHKDIINKGEFSNRSVSKNQNNNFYTNNSNYHNQQDTQRIIQLVEYGLRRSLGQETAALVFKTLKLVYQIEKEHIVSHPKLFEDKISKMIGSSGDIVLKMISETIIFEITS